MICAFVNDNKVIKIEEIEDPDLIRHLWQHVLPVDELPRSPSVGWLSTPEGLKPDIRPVTPRQIRQAIILSGLTLSMVTDAIAQLPEPYSSLASVEWEYSTLVFRDNKLVPMLAAVQGMTEQQVDDLFILAGSL